MGAATQLAGERPVPDLDHPYDLAVLLVEQRHRAERLGLVERRGERPHRVGLQDPRVDRAGDRGEIVAAQPAGVREVEAQLSGPT